MAINSCDICNCIPQNIDEAFFNQAALNLLCQVVTNTGGGGVAEDVNLTKVGGTAVAAGQGLMAASIPVVIASNQSTLNVLLTAGTAGIGKLTANSGIDIGDVDVTSVVPGTAATNLGKAHNVAMSTGDTGVAAWTVRDDTNSQVSTTNGRYAPFIIDNLNGLKVSTAQRTTFTHTQPTFTNATSFTLLAANTARRYVEIQNNSAANIMINVNAGTLTGIVPTSTNLGIVIPSTAGSNTWRSPPNAVPTAAITGYQTSGGSINTVSITEG